MSLLNWNDKKNSPILADFIAKHGAEYCMTAEEINELRDTANSLDLSSKGINSNDSLLLARRKGDVLHGIIDQFTGEEITLSKVTGTPIVDNIIYFQLGSEYFIRNFKEINVKFFGAKGDAINDDTLAIQKALNQYANPIGAHSVVFLPSGRYKITSTIIVPEHVRMIGESADIYGPGETGTEIGWYGASGSTAVITSTGDDYDWSRGSIENLRIKNYTAVATGYGLRVRNAQNGSYIRNVTISGFPERQCYVYEPTGRVGAGTCPGFFIIDKSCFFIGGIIPLEIQVGVEQVVVDGFGVDTDASSIMGIKLTKSAAGVSQRAPIILIGGKVEIQQASLDIDGIVWDQDLVICFNTVAVQRNDNITSTKAAFRYTGTGRNIPTAVFSNCTSWNLLDILKLDSAGISKAVLSISVPQSFSWDKENGDSSYMFGRETLTAGMSSQTFNTANSSNLGGIGYVVPRDCVLAGISARHSASITNDAITLSVIKNGVTFIISLSLNSSNQGRFTNLFDGTVINSSNFKFNAGDRVSMQITTGGTFAPIGGHVVGNLFFRPF